MSSALRVLRHRDFRYLFLGQAASQIGDRAVVVALALYITQRSGSPSDLGVILFAQALALVLLLLLGGVWADRLPRHRIMVATDVVRATLHALLAVLILFGRPAVWEIAAIEALFGAAQAFFQPAYSGLLPQTVPESRIQDARAVTESMANLAFLIGPVIATALVLGRGRLGGVRARRRHICPQRRAAHAGHPSTPRRDRGPTGGHRGGPARRLARGALAQLGVGDDRRVHRLGHVRVRPVVSLAPRIARDVYGSAGLFGVLEALTGVGAVLGSFVGLRWRPLRPLVVGILLVLFWPLNDLAFALGAPLAAPRRAVARARALAGR